MKKQLLTAICFYHVNDGRNPHKYRNISGIDKFMIFAKTKGFLYVNFYDKETKNFIERRWVNDN